MKIDFKFEHRHFNTLYINAHLTRNGDKYFAELSEIEELRETKVKTRQLKRLYSQVFLKVLEEATDMHQS